MQAISDLGDASATPKSGAPTARVTSGVRKSGGVAYPIISATPGGAGMTSPLVLLLSSTAGIFETLESHQVSTKKSRAKLASIYTGSCIFRLVYLFRGLVLIIHKNQELEMCKLKYTYSIINICVNVAHFFCY